VTVRFCEHAENSCAQFIQLLWSATFSIFAWLEESLKIARRFGKKIWADFSCFFAGSGVENNFEFARKP
jgi:hypothetical protein